MKKPSKKTTKTEMPSLENMLTKINEGIHEDLESLLNEIDSKELDGFLDKDHDVNLRKIEQNEDIEARDVLLLGSYLAYKHMHENLHKIIDKEATHLKEYVVSGKGNLPKELREMLDEIVDDIEKIVKEGKK